MKQLILLLLLLPISASAQAEFLVFFDFNEEVPNEASMVDFNAWMAQNRDAEILEISGHADSVDANNYNRELSFRRINSVMALLKSQKITISESVKMNPLGEDFLQSANQAENRRVSFKYRKWQKASPDEENTDAVTSLPADELETDALSESVRSKFENAKKGDLIRIHNINFYLNSEKVVPKSEPVMLDLFETLKNHPGLRIEIHGHICCNPNTNDTKLSYRRAKYIFTYLLKKGIALNRLAYKGFGSSRPIYPIPEKWLREEEENRRVEILIVETALPK